MPISESPLSGIHFLRTQSLTSEVQKEIERMIMNGEFQPNSRLNENKLATRLGVSRGPVREACRALAAMRLLDVIPNRGFILRSLTNEDVAKVYEARAGLCGYAGMLLAKRATAEDIAQLRSLVDEMDNVASEHDVERYYQLNLEFHNTLMLMTGNSKLAEIYRSLVREIHLFRLKALSHGDAPRVSNAEHHGIVDAITSGDPKRAFDAMMEHVKASQNRLLSAPDR